MFSFKDGMQVLPNAIAEYLGDKVKLNANVDKLLKSENGYKVRYNVNGVPSEIEQMKLSVPFLHTQLLKFLTK
jgi:monoamine oxidase